MPSLRLGLGLDVLSSNVNLYDPAKDTDLAFWTNERSGLTLPDEVSTNEASILVPVASFSGSNRLFSATKVTGGQSWDLTIRFKLANAAGNNPLYSCGGYSGAVKGLMIRSNNGTLNIFTGNGTAAVSSNFAFAFQSSTWYTLRFQWSGVTGETMTCTVGATVLTATTCNAWSGDSGDFPNIGCYSNAVFMIGYISKVSGKVGQLNLDIYPLGLSNYEFDTNAVKFDWAGTQASVYESGDTYYLDKGYQLYSNGTLTYYIPNKSTGELNALPSLGGGYSVTANVIGSLTSHNLFNSKLRFVNAFFDRSNTTIWGDLARGADYDSGNKKDFLIEKINILTLRSWLNADYRGMLYPVCDGNSIDDKLYLQGLLLYTTDKKGADEVIPLTYTKDIRRTQKVINTGAYILDGDGYIQTYIYGDMGGDAVANFTYLQGLLDSGNLIVSGTEYEVYAISQPLKPTTGRTVTVNSELRIKKGTTVNLTSNVAINDTVINVDSVTGFAIGEYVAISDDLLAVVGSIGQTRRVASCGKITDIGESTITIDQGSKYAVTAASGGKLGHLQSVILIDSANSVNIAGSGIINGNKDYQYDVEPVNDTSEEQRQGCGVSIVESNNVKINGTGTLRVKNAILHGISGSGVINGTKAIGLEIANVNAYDNHDKNILCLFTDGTHIHDCTVSDAVFEDGIIMYVSNINFIIERISASGNPRSGISINSNGICNGIVRDIITGDSVSILSSNIELSNIMITGTGYLQITDAYSAGNNITIDTLTFDGAAASSLLTFLGAVKDIAITNLQFNDCTGKGIYADKQTAGSVYPDNVTIDGGGFVNHSGTKTDIVPTSDVTFTNFTGL